MNYNYSITCKIVNREGKKESVTSEVRLQKKITTEKERKELEEIVREIIKEKYGKVTIKSFNPPYLNPACCKK